MHLVILVGIGGFIGAILRYFMSGWVQSSFLAFPAGTFFVNFMGTLALSIIMFLTEFKGLFNEETRVFLTIGLLGAFTTMSTFSYESFKLLEQKELFLFGANVLGTVILTIAAVYLGKTIVMSLWRI